MSAFSDKLTQSMSTIMMTPWDVDEEDEVPKTAEVKLSDGAVRVEAAYLYADLGESTLLQKRYKNTFAAKVIRMFLNGSSQIIRENHGQIKSFDGDRVMGVFVGGSKRNNAANAALKINWLVSQSINPIVAKRLDDTKTDAKWTVSHGVGVDVGEAFIARAGVRNSKGETTHNDLISIGRAPNVAAKLSAVRNLHKGPSIITSDVYDYLKDAQKLGGADKEPMWTGPHRKSVGPYTMSLYASTWWRQP
ncbi:hypothetical protein [Nocardioides sp.]|uniref:hypothetical protein n=1 Tax=Nocardioides sp. TaxID=35761 RepID=UPI003D097336